MHILIVGVNAEPCWHQRYYSKLILPKTRARTRLSQLQSLETRGNQLTGKDS